MSNGNKNDDWLKGMKSLLIITSIISLGLIGFYAFYTRGIISSKQSDWAAFGSFLSGVFSFFGAIGTVGVMILAIKQFKVQQAQIDDQNKRQDDFESRQQKKWDKENEMLNFQKFLLHKTEFKKLIKDIESSDDFPFEIKNIDKLYALMFAKNSFEETSYAYQPQDELDFFDMCKHRLDEAIRFNYRPMDNTPQAAFREIKKFRDYLFCEGKNRQCVGDILIDNRSSGINVFEQDKTFKQLLSLIQRLQDFCGNTLPIQPTYPGHKTSNNLENYALSSQCEFSSAFKPFQGLKELIELQREAKNHFTDGFNINVSQLENKDYIEKIIEDFQHGITVFNSDEGNPNELEWKLKAFKAKVSNAYKIPVTWHT
ncbi:hypothetical protein [Shewanella sp. MEBiC00475]|uniref:hypothetical protein n=1 Tax=Shewanella sp. MEBiC00475 TaxID=2575361 RepID=UPI0010C050EA|nr:hypothetical protein [Shewanella sp. MEBiC00475]